MDVSENMEWVGGVRRGRECVRERDSRLRGGRGRWEKVRGIERMEWTIGSRGE